MRQAILCLVSLSYFLFPVSCLASSEFNTSYHSLYTVDQEGVTLVTHTINLVNNLAHIYATEYSFALTGLSLTNLVVSDETGTLPASITSANGTSTINIDIANPVVGKDQSKQLSISYRTQDVATRIGNTLTINIPRLANSNEAQEYVRTIQVPGVDGVPQLLFPPPSQTFVEGDNATFIYRDQGSGALTLLFGESSTYRVTLDYLLKNESLQSIDSELSLPPDTPYQRILLDSLVPPPTDIRVDDDGNWLARYKLKPQEKLAVKAIVYATVSPQARYPDPSLLTPSLLTPAKYWESKSDAVATLARQLKTPAQFYSYLTSNFVYNFDKSLSGANRLGANKSLDSPTNVVCTEFTDTFVALARAVGISSREINGYAYTTGSSLQPLSSATDVLHAWPEYFDVSRQSWIQVDPTWGHTTGGVDYFNKLDFSHITFVRHGQESEYPLPAGVYKDNSQDKSIFVEVADVTPSPISQSVVRDGKIYNTGNVAVIDPAFGYLPPYGVTDAPTPARPTLYDKIKQLCVNLFSKFFRRPPASL